MTIELEPLMLPLKIPFPSQHYELQFREKFLIISHHNFPDYFLAGQLSDQ